MLIADYKELAHWRSVQTNSRIVCASGCFDVLHVGHLRYLQFAKNLGSVLLVAINSDESVRLLKGSSRPINCASDRASLLLALRPVDYVFVFNDVRATKMLSALRPDVWVKGSDYSLKTLNRDEANAVKSYGGQIAFAPMVQGMSTTKTISKMSV
jgi:rfaE bifunctional protein nucleotidyltransferase chain/domain